MIDRPMPAAVESERAALSCCLQWPDDAIDPTLERLPENTCMWTPANRLILGAIRELRQTCQPREIDLIVITTHLENGGKLDMIGGMETLNGLLNVAPTSTALPKHLSAIAEAHARRRLIGVASTYAAKAYEADISTGSLMEEAEKAFLAVTETQTGPDRKPDTNAEILAEMWGRIESAAKGTLRTVSYGIHPLLDERTPAEFGKVTVIAARPRVGKTSFMRGAAINQASAGHPIGIVCIEMSNPDVMMANVAQLSGVPFTVLRDGLRRFDKGQWHQVTAAERQAVMEASDRLVSLPMHLHCGRGMTLRSVCGMVRYWNRYCGVRVVYIDHLTRLVPPGAGDRLRYHMREITSGLKQLALDLDISVNELAQLGRVGGNTQPRLEHLKECGNIEEDADYIILIDRPDVDEPNPGKRDYRDQNGNPCDMKNKAALIQAKCRFSSQGIVMLDFDGPRTQFCRAARRHVEDEV